MARTPIIETDICVIGGGSGGLSIAAGAVQMGARVVLFEAGSMGGDCLNTGCVPSKAMLAAAKAAHHAQGNDAMGITGNAIVDFAAVKAHVAQVIKQIEPHDSPARFKSLGVQVISEYARFDTVRDVVSDSHHVRAKYIVIASGSQPFIPPIMGLDNVAYHTNESIFTDPQKPSHLLIVGGGPIGVEMAQAHIRLGCRVTVIEGVKILPRDDAALVDILRQQLINEGVDLIEGVGVKNVANVTDKAGGAGVTLTLANEQHLTGSHLLIVTGRKPALDGLCLDKAGIGHSKSGIITDARLRTSNRRVFAIGDVTGRQQFTHIAGYHAGIVIRNCLFKIPARINDDLVPWVTYCDPELAHVGLRESDAIARFGADKVVALETPLSGNDRAIAEGRSEGMVRAITHRNGRILGASILAPAAGEMIHAWSFAISSKSKIGSMANTIAPYPSFSDASKRTAGSFFTSRLFSAQTRRLVRFLLKF